MARSNTGCCGWRRIARGSYSPGYRGHLGVRARDIALLFEKFKDENDDVRGAYIDVIEAEIFIQGTTYDVAPDGEIIKRPRR
jgi:hypothetical protein